MIMGPEGRLYLTDVEHGTIRVMDLKQNKLATIADQRLSWPDSLAWGPDGGLYVSTSQIQEMPRFNGGRDMHRLPYHIYKIAGILAAP